MRKIVLLLICLLSVIVCNSQTLIDCSYQKHCKDEDGEQEESEFSELLDSEINIDYKDFHTAGNVMDVSFRVLGNDGKSFFLQE